MLPAARNWEKQYGYKLTYIPYIYDHRYRALATIMGYSFKYVEGDGRYPCCRKWSEVNWSQIKPVLHHKEQLTRSEVVTLARLEFIDLPYSKLKFIYLTEGQYKIITTSKSYKLNINDKLKTESQQFLKDRYINYLEVDSVNFNRFKNISLAYRRASNYHSEFDKPI